LEIGRILILVKKKLAEKKGESLWKKLRMGEAIDQGLFTNGESTGSPKDPRARDDAVFPVML
jgi:hypothetical protein